MPNRTAWTCVWFSMVVSALNATSPTAQAEFTFFTSRAAWEAEASNRGLPIAEENFDAFADGLLGDDIPSFAVGNLEFNPVPFSGQVLSGKLVPTLGSAVRFGPLELGRPGPNAGTVEGPIGGIGMDLDVTDATTDRGLNLILGSDLDCPLTDPQGPISPCAVVTERH